MARSRLKVKGRGKSPPFARLWHSLLDLPEYIDLTDKSKALLMDLLRQYNGVNNGDFSITLSIMKKRGWNSNGKLTRARDELIEAGLILQTRQGGRHKCSLYGVTWEPLNECAGKLEVEVTPAPILPLSLKNRKPIPLGGIQAA